MFNELKATIPHINSEANPPPTLSMLFASIWDSFSAQDLGVAIVPTCYKIESVGGVLLDSGKWNIQEFPEFFSEIDLISIIDLRYCTRIYTICKSIFLVTMYLFINVSKYNLNETAKSACITNSGKKIEQIIRNF